MVIDMGIQIEEFPGVPPEVIRSTVARTAEAANLFAMQGAIVCGIDIQVCGDRLVGSARLLADKAEPAQESELK